MPKYATEQTSSRKQIDIYDIRKNNYSPSLEVVARPTDPMVQQGYDSDLTNTVDLLKQFSQGVESYSVLQKSQAQDNQVQAAADVEKGVYNKPNNLLNLGAGYDETWDLLSAKKDTSENLTPIIAQYQADNSHLSPAEFDAGLQKIVTEFRGRMKSPHQVVGFAQEAEALVANARKFNLETNIKNKQIERDGILTANIRTDTETSLRENLGLDLTEDLTSKFADINFRTWLATPEGVLKKTALAKNLYDKYRVGLQDAKALGKTTAQYSAEYLSTVANMAEKYGMPELLDYADHTYTPTPEEMAQGKQPDKRTVADTYPEVVQRARMRAAEVESKIDAAIQKQVKEREEEEKKLYIGDMEHQMFTVLNGNDPNKGVLAEQLMTEFHKNAAKYNLGPEERKYMDAQYLAVRDLGTFAPVDDDRIVNSLYAKYSDIKVSEIVSNRRSMTRGTYLELLKHASSLEEGKRNRATTMAAATAKERQEKALNLAIKGIRAGYEYDSNTLKLYPDAAQDVSKFDQLLGAAISSGEVTNTTNLQDWYRSKVQPHLPIRAALTGPRGDNKPPQVGKVFPKEALPSASANKGRSMIDPDTGHKIISNGTSWVDAKSGKVVR